jgi:branched-chain amino acid transport system permease protein
MDDLPVFRNTRGFQLTDASSQSYPPSNRLSKIAGEKPLRVIVGRSVWLEYVGDSLVIGLTEHAPLVLAAMGFALLYRLTGLINVAYSETITLGAYFGMWVNTTFDLNFYTVLIPAGILSGLISVGTYFAIFRPAKRRNVGALELIIISFGLSVFLRHGLQFVFGYPVRFFDVPPPDTIFVLGVGVASFRLLALASVAVLALLLYWFIQRSNYGLQIRALASDEDLAQVSGIRPLLVTVLIWFIAGVAGGLAGAFYGVGSAVAPLLGWRQFLLILLVVLVGGGKNIGGVIATGVATGVALAAMTLTFGQVLYAQLALIIGFIIILKIRGNPYAEAGKV